MGNRTYLVVMGIPSIKKYVFSTDRLMEIRGASALLYHLNRDEMKDFLQKCPELSDVDCIFVGGGFGQFIINADETRLEDCLKALEGLFSSKTGGGLQLIWGKAEYTGSNYQDALQIAEHSSEAKRDETPFIQCTQIHTGFIRECDSCSEMATSLKAFGDEDRLLCNVCYKKMDYGRKARKGLWKKFSDFLKERGIELESPVDFEQIGEQCMTRKGYTALVYADGNAMGKLIKQISDKEDFGFFSKTVDSSIRKACHEALYETFETFFKGPKKKPDIIPAEILLLGGDDLLVYLTAEGALPFAIKVAKKFNEETKKEFARSPFFKEKLEGKGLTISLGIAYGKSHTPFAILLDQAEELLRLAKKKGSQDKRTGDFYMPTYIDYHFSSNFNQISIKDCRTIHMEIKKDKPIRLYQKPYSLEDAEALLEHGRNLREIGIPKTRLNRLGNAPTLGKINGTLECLKLYTRTSANPQRNQRKAIWDALARFDCITNMPWKDEGSFDSTMLVDLIELAGFCETNATESEGISNDPSY